MIHECGTSIDSRKQMGGRGKSAVGPNLARQSRPESEGPLLLGEVEGAFPEGFP